MPYERIIQWLAGPFSAFVGVLAMKAAGHLSFLGQVGLGKDATAHAIQNAAVFAATALVTYAAHHKWLENLSKWWVTPRGSLEDTKPAQLQPPPVNYNPPYGLDPEKGPGA